MDRLEVSHAHKLVLTEIFRRLRDSPMFEVLPRSAQNKVNGSHGTATQRARKGCRIRRNAQCDVVPLLSEIDIPVLERNIDYNIRIQTSVFSQVIRHVLQGREKARAAHSHRTTGHCALRTQLQLDLLQVLEDA